MSSFSHFPAVVRTRGTKSVVGRFKPNGSSAITNTQKSTVFGRGWSVAYTSTGKYTITIKGTYGYYLHADFTLMSSTIVGGGVFRVNSVTTSGQNTIVVVDHFAETAGTMALADIAAAAGNFVSFEILFLDSKEDR